MSSAQITTSPLRSAAERYGFADIATAIELKYWHPIREGALVETFILDPSALEAPGAHPGLFSDHGVTHVRDIAELVVALAERNDGILIEVRPPERATFIVQIALFLTYLHDIGMVAPTATARRVHPQFAAQVAFGIGFSSIIDQTWNQFDLVRTRLAKVHQDLKFGFDPTVLLREVWAISLAHSKSVVPANFLDDRPALRGLLQRSIVIPLEKQTAMTRSELLCASVNSFPSAEATIHYHDTAVESFAWLIHPALSAVELAHDVIDATRLLRAADALRTRGVSLRTSGGYEICVDPRTGRAVYGLRSSNGQHGALLSVDNPISAAESNIAFATIGDEGELNVGFNRSFADVTVSEQIISSTADLLADIEADAIASFAWPATNLPVIELVSTSGEEPFVTAVASRAQSRHRRLEGRISVVVGDQPSASDADLQWLEGAAQLDANDGRFQVLLAEMGRRGFPSLAVEAASAARGVLFRAVEPGTVLMRAGTTSPIVVVPMGEGLHVYPASGAEPQPLRPWLPAGATGVVRGGCRNAEVRALDAVEVAVIFAESYLAHWFRPYSISEIGGVVSNWNTEVPHE